MNLFPVFNVYMGEINFNITQMEVRKWMILHLKGLLPNAKTR